MDDFSGCVDPLHFGDMNMYIPGMVKDFTEREGDAGRFQPGRGDLVHQRLEFVVIVTIDQVDIARGIVEGARYAQPCKTGADDDDTCPFAGGLFHTIMISSGVQSYGK